MQGRNRGDVGGNGLDVLRMVVLVAMVVAIAPGVHHDDGCHHDPLDADVDHQSAMAADDYCGDGDGGLVVMVAMVL